MLKGFVKAWDEHKGLGYIETADTDDVFVHFSGITNPDGRRTLRVGDMVTFVIVEGSKGPQAAKVTVIVEENHGR